MAQAAEERLSAAQRSKIRRLTNPRELSPDEEEGGELNIVPFLDIVMNVLMFVLATISVAFTATLDTEAPKIGAGGRAPSTPTLNLTVLVVADGFTVSAAGDHISPGCDGRGGEGLTIPKKNGVYDYAALGECAKKLKAVRPEFKDEEEFTLSANPNIPVQVLISCMDAVRNDADGTPLFPKVLFGVVGGG